MMTLAQKIIAYAQAKPEGTVLSAKALLHLGSRAGIDQALSRLAIAGGLLRIGRGLYVAPVSGRFGVRPPTAGAVATSVAQNSTGEFGSHGAVAANSLGLSTQIPTAAIFETTGPSRTLRVGKRVLEIQHVPAWHFAAKGMAGEAIRALGWLGQRHASEAVETLRGRLSGEERFELLEARSRLPNWMAETVSALA